MIRVENVSKSFNGDKVLENITATFEAGKTNLIIGKSGSGKSVLVKCMVGLLQVDTGNIYFDDVNYTQLTQKQRKEIRMKIGMLFQSNALFDSLTVEQNVAFPLDMFTKMTYKEKMNRVNEVLDRVNLGGNNKKKPAEISGGMQKRVGIARAIVMNPKYLFCDEPNSGLDPKTAMVIDELIQEITDEYKITTIVNTHDMSSVMESGDKILMLHQGRNHWTGTRHEILYSDNQELEDFIFASNFLKEAKKALISKNSGQ